MLIAIISDIHDNLANLEKALNWIRKNGATAYLICCGDITNIDTVSCLAGNFPGEIFVVAGNAELYEEKDLNKFKNINYCGEIGINEFDGLNIAFCHEPEKIKKINEITPIALDFIFYGHTHKPWLKKDGPTIIANPGTVSGVFNAATFAVIETKTKKLELKIIADLV